MSKAVNSLVSTHRSTLFVGLLKSMRAVFAMVARKKGEKWLRMLSTL